MRALLLPNILQELAAEKIGYLNMKHERPFCNPWGIRAV